MTKTTDHQKTTTSKGDLGVAFMASLSASAYNEIRSQQELLPIQDRHPEFQFVLKPEMTCYTNAGSVVEFDVRDYDHFQVVATMTSFHGDACPNPDAHVFNRIVYAHDGKLNFLVAYSYEEVMEALGQASDKILEPYLGTE